MTTPEEPSPPLGVAAEQQTRLLEQDPAYVDRGSGARWARRHGERVCTCTVRLPEAGAVLLFTFLQNRGFGKKGVWSNVTKSFSVLGFFLFKGLKGPLLPCGGKGQEDGRSHTEPPSCHPHRKRK